MMPAEDGIILTELCALALISLEKPLHVREDA